MEMGVDMDMNIDHGHFSSASICFKLSLGVNTEKNCFDIKAKQPKKRLVSESAETSLGSSFGDIETKTSFVRHPTYNAVHSCASGVIQLTDIQIPALIQLGPEQNN
jgi:hypothetical protein